MNLFRCFAISFALSFAAACSSGPGTDFKVASPDGTLCVGIDLPTLKGWLRRLAENGPKTVVATSVPLADGQASRKPECTSVLAYERDEDRFWRVDCSYIPAYYPGTGDVFASVLTGSLLQGDSLAIALDRAVQFVTLGIRATFGQGLPNREGILLERILDTLRAPLGSYMCRLVD